MKLEGAVAIVTGGAGLVGKAVCTAFLDKGAKVCIAEFDEELGKALQESLSAQYGEENCLFAYCDVSNEESFKEVFELTKKKFGTVDIVVNNAAIFNDLKWKRMLDVNLGGAMCGTLLGMQYMGKDNGGRGGVIINVSSEAGRVNFCGMPTYSTTKAGINAFTACWAHPLHKENHGVRLNIVAPAAVLKTQEASERKNRDVKMYLTDKVMDGLKNLIPVPAETIAGVMVEIIENDSVHGQLVSLTPDGAVWRTLQSVDLLYQEPNNK